MAHRDSHSDALAAGKAAQIILCFTCRCKRPPAASSLRWVIVWLVWVFNAQLSARLLRLHVVPAPCAVPPEWLRAGLAGKVDAGCVVGVQTVYCVSFNLPAIPLQARKDVIV